MNYNLFETRTIMSLTQQNQLNKAFLINNNTIGGEKMNKLYYEAGERIRELRISQHMTREKLADKADISTQSLYNIETGRKGFSGDTLYRLADALSVDGNYILYGSTSMTTAQDINELLHRFTPSQQLIIKQLLEDIHKLCTTIK